MKYIVNDRFFVIFVSLLVLSTLFSCKRRADVSATGYYIMVERDIETNFRGRYTSCFNDKNDYHLEAAAKYGINPLSSVSNISANKLCEIRSCEFYHLDSLTHSHPYLVNRAKNLLSDIGRSFNDSLRSRGGEGYNIIVTSLLRVSDDIKKLRRRNVNAAENSAHSYATTFDISYRRFYNNNKRFVISEENLRNLLAEILFSYKEANACYVKYEVKQGCFHVTTR